ncbi:hypothetical protein ACFL56_03140 [Candidatus Margulisiibacteriota bacterium]
MKNHSSGYYWAMDAIFNYLSHKSDCVEFSNNKMELTISDKASNWNKKAGCLNGKDVKRMYEFLEKTRDIKLKSKNIQNKWIIQNEPFVLDCKITYKNSDLSKRLKGVTGLVRDNVTVTFDTFALEPIYKPKESGGYLKYPSHFTRLRKMILKNTNMSKKDSVSIIKLYHLINKQSKKLFKRNIKSISEMCLSNSLKKRGFPYFKFKLEQFLNIVKAIGKNGNVQEIESFEISNEYLIVNKK